MCRAESFADDLRTSQGVVGGRAVPTAIHQDFSLQGWRFRRDPVGATSSPLMGGPCGGGEGSKEEKCSPSVADLGPFHHGSWRWQQRRCLATRQVASYQGERAAPPPSASSPSVSEGPAARECLFFFVCPPLK